MPIWQRKTELAIGPEGKKGRAWGETLRVSWTVRHKLNTNPTSATIKLFNPSQDSVDYIREDKKVAQLKIGHKTLAQIFVGYIQKIREETDRSDRKLVLECSDKAFEGHKKFVNKSFPAGVSVADVIKELASEAGIPVGRIDFPEDTPSLKRTITVAKMVKSGFQEVAETYGLRFWTIDGKLYVAPKDKPQKSSVEVTEFSQKNRTLFGVEPMKKGRIKVRGLAKPEIRPGTLFALQHNRYDGGWRARDVTFSGDSGWADQNEVQVTAEPR